MLLLWKTIRIEAGELSWAARWRQGQGSETFGNKRKCPNRAGLTQIFYQTQILETSPQESGYQLKAVNSEKAVEPMVPNFFNCRTSMVRSSAAFS